MIPKRKIRTHTETLDFTRGLIKGKIAEVVFQEMAIYSGKCLVLPLGYEHTTPILSQYTRKNSEVRRVLENIRNAPDFALIEHGSDAVYLVEVKYRRNYSSSEIFFIASDLYKVWPTAFLFLATAEGFYYSSVADILNSNGEMRHVTHSMSLDEKTVADYHALLLQYELK